MAVYKITNVGANKCLNINGDQITALTNNQNVTLWSDSGTNEQRWETLLGSIMYIKSVIDPEFALNANRSANPYNCEIYKWKGTSGSDNVVNFVASGSNYKIQLANQTNLYLTAEGSNNGSKVIWAAANNTNYQLWACVSAKPAPTASTRTTCKVECSIYQNCTYPTHLNGAHKGVDISSTKNAAGDPIYAVLPGTATISAWPGNGSSRGSFVTVDSTNYTIIYQHLDSMLVSNGSSVAAGQIIGKMGSTGGGTGVHLHIEVYDKITKKYINYPSIP